MTAAVTTLKDVLIQLIANMSPSPIPVTTLARPGLIGDATVYLTSAAGFVPDGLFRILDGTSERTLVVLNANTTTGQVDIDMARCGGGLLAAHLAGAQVITNATSGLPTKVSPMLNSGKAVISVNALDRSKRREFNSGWTPRYVVQLCHLLPLDQRDTVELNEQLWTEENTKQAEADSSAIEELLQNNEVLMLAGIPYATNIDRFVASSRGNAEDYDVPCWETWMDIVLRGVDE